MTITVPFALKQRMDAIGDRVNWSAVASAAFERKVAEVSTTKELSDLNEVVQKLRAAKARAEDTAFKDGERAGQRYVRESASHAKAAAGLLDELARLERRRRRCGRDWDDAFAADAQTAYSPAERLAFVLHPEYEGDRRFARAFWTEALGDDANAAEDPSFVQGFAEGALALWGEISDRL
jgi:hypothetical protein